MSAPWGVGGSHQVFWHLLLTLQTLVVTSSSSKSPLLGQEIQLTFPRQWEQMLVYHRNTLWWPLYLVLPFPSDLCPSEQLVPIRHARRKQVGHFKLSNPKWGSSQSLVLHFRANLIAHCPCSAFEGTTYFCQQCASYRRHFSVLCTIFFFCQTDNSCQLPKLTMTYVWPSFEYSFTHAKDKDGNAKEERK